MTRVRMSKVGIPAQRGRRSGPPAHVIHLGNGAEPMVLVVPHTRGSLTSRFALAAARTLWKHRIALAPIWVGVGLFTTTAVLSLALPGTALALALPAVLVPAGWAGVVYRHPHSVVRRKVRARLVPAAALSGVLAWSSAAVWCGPGNRVLALLWLLGTAAGQATWWHLRRKTPTAPLTADQADRA
ncbi:hypothetical protein ACFV6F_04075 [Kitasatospora phosalacinea]|uniref:hypothetical protein n=1 Tax=Kitasatospora phosalacinea TaxID=2065 RepID=UPI00364CBA43